MILKFLRFGVRLFGKKDIPTLVAEQLAIAGTMPYDDDIPFYPVFNGLAHENLDDYIFDVERLVAGTKLDERQLLVRRLGGMPGALSRREIKATDIAVGGGNFILTKFLEGKCHRNEVLEGKSLATRRYKTLTRRPGQTFQEFFGVENMACADALKEGVTVDMGPQAYHMLAKSGMADEQINLLYVFVHDPEGASLDPQNVQSTALRFYDKPWDVRHRDARIAFARYIRLVVGGGQHGGRPRSRGKGSSTYVCETWAQEPFLTPREDA